MKNYRKIIWILCMILLCGGLNISFVSHGAPLVQSYGDELVIVIDPGHGGKNLGTTQNGFEEKTMTLATARAMYDELTQFDNVTVYMTRNEDKDLSLAERAAFAASVDADFLFSLHYNASENHTHFGSEIWIPYDPPYNAYGYQFGYQFLAEMKDMGLFLRGIKTRLGDNGDYYGIIRESVALSVPAVILEHCHVDEARDIPYCKTEEEWIAFGKRDARAVAKYFGLSSKNLGVDYSSYSLNLPKVNEAVTRESTRRDETDPDVCMIELLDTNYETGEVLLQVTATDYDSPLLYYDYSYDGGESYCASIAWPGVDLLAETFTDTFTLSLQIPSGVQPEIVLRAYNLADLYIESNHLPILHEFWYEDNTSQTTTDAETTESSSDTTSNLPKRHTAGTVTFTPVSVEEVQIQEDVSFLTFLEICLAVVIVLLVIVLISQSISYSRRKRRRRQRRKEWVDINDQVR